MTSKNNNNKKKRKPKYFDNNWQEFYEAPADMFQEHTYEEFMEWRGESWQLPSSVCCIIRVQDLDTLKVKEFVYRRQSAAEKKVQQLLNNENIEFTVCRATVMHLIQPALIDYD